MLCMKGEIKGCLNVSRHFAPYNGIALINPLQLPLSPACDLLFSAKSVKFTKCLPTTRLKTGCFLFGSFEDTQLGVVAKISD